MAALGSSSLAMLKDWNASYWLKFHASNMPCSPSMPHVMSKEHMYLKKRACDMTPGRDDCSDQDNIRSTHHSLLQDLLHNRDPAAQGLTWSNNFCASSDVVEMG